MNKWAIIGIGAINSRHISSISEIGDELVAACDIDKNKQLLFDKDIKFFTNYKKMLKECPEIEWVAICAPNHLHYKMITECFRNNKKVLCEKPLVRYSFQVNKLKRFKNKKLYPVLQLRQNPDLQELKKQQFKNSNIKLVVHVHRGKDYFNGWKGDKKKSGGILLNIGIHYFDLLIWLFGEPKSKKIEYKDAKQVIGSFYFSNNNKVFFNISLKAPENEQIKYLSINGNKIDLTKNFTNLHTQVYKNAKEGRGVGLHEIYKSLKLVEKT